MPILIAAASVYSGFLLLWYKKVLRGKRNQWIYLCISVVLCVAAFVLSVEYDLYRAGFFIVMGTVMVAFRLTFDSNNLQALYFSTFYVLSIYSSRGIIASAFSLLKNESINYIFGNQTYNDLIWILAALFSISIFVLRREIFSHKNEIKQLFRYPDQVRFVAVSRVVLIIYMALIDEGRYHDVPYTWLAITYYLSCLMVKMLMLFVESHAIRVSVQLEYELNTRQLEEQLSRQMRHYQSYKKYTEKFDAFQHDFKNMMASVSALISNNEYEKALSLINEIHNDLKKSSIVNNTYSNNIIADAIMQDTANLCEVMHIHFEAMVQLPDVLPISDIELVRLLSNIIDNAVEGCCRVPVTERFIKASSTCIEGWISIEITNSYDGLAAYNGEELQTSKPNKLSHGRGLRIVREIVENNGGILYISANQEEKKFSLRLHIPQQIN
ncbi:MAG: GHKL domain-containing protein [Oscillospiraceae bacterium]|nr:GHKL domain-containing protein [Oscillospiraceae bacterium]